MGFKRIANMKADMKALIAGEADVNTGLPKEAYEEWLGMDLQSRRDVVGIFTTPEQIQAVRELGK